MCLPCTGHMLALWFILIILWRGRQVTHPWLFFRNIYRELFVSSFDCERCYRSASFFDSFPLLYECMNITWSVRLYTLLFPILFFNLYLYPMPSLFIIHPPLEFFQKSIHQAALVRTPLPPQRLLHQTCHLRRNPSARLHLHALQHRESLVVHALGSRVRRPETIEKRQLQRGPHPTPALSLPLRDAPLSDQVVGVVDVAPIPLQGPPSSAAVLARQQLPVGKDDERGREVSENKTLTLIPRILLSR